MVRKCVEKEVPVCQSQCCDSCCNDACCDDGCGRKARGGFFRKCFAKKNRGGDCCDSGCGCGASTSCGCN
jgi:hypothetical protein